MKVFDFWHHHILEQTNDDLGFSLSLGLEKAKYSKYDAAVIADGIKSLIEKFWLSKEPGERSHGR